MIESPPPSPTLHVRSTRRLQGVALIARVLLSLVVVAWLLFGASWGVLHGWIVPRISEFRPRLERVASQALGMQVRIGQISAKSGGLIPSVELQDVVLLDAQGREALRLPRLLAAISPSSLWGKGFEQLFIDQPALEIRRAADGRIFVGGIDISQEHANGNAVADWIFSQAEMSIKGGTIRWTDDVRHTPPLVLSGVDAVLRNGLRSHSMRLDATPPTQWGERFSLRGLFRQPLLTNQAGDWKDWSGQLYAELNRIDMSQVKQYASLDTLGVDLKTGSGSLRAWADVTQGKVVGGTADVALTAVDAQFGKTLKPLTFDSVVGRFGGKQLPDGFDFNTEGLLFRTSDGLRWPGGNLALVYRGSEGRTDQKTELKGDKLDLAAMAEVASRLPIGDAAQALVSSYAPKGLIETIDARWQLPLQGPLTFAAKGRVTGLEVASLPATPAAGGVGAGSGTATHALPGRPGVSGAAVAFDVTQLGGKASVNIAKGTLDLPGIFEDSRIPLDTLAMDAQWTLSNGHIDTQLRNIKFSNADAEGLAQASWKSGDAVVGQATKAPLGVLDLQGSLSRGNGSRVHRYLPLVLPEQVRHYVRDSVLEGNVSDVTFRVKGPVDKLPFTDPSAGEFKVTAKVKNGSFVYVPRSIQPRDSKAWPALADVQGELTFNRASVDIESVTAKVAGLPGLKLKGNARIANLMHAATVEVDANVQGPLTDALSFVNASPISAMISEVLAQASGTGAGDYGVQLVLPLLALQSTKVKGTVSLPGNDVQFTPSTPLLSRLKGVATFNEAGFNVASAQARLLGGDIHFEGGTRIPARGATGVEAESVVAFKGQGSITADGARQAKDFGFASRLAQNASGTTTYGATLAFRRNMTELLVTSNLQGMALTLPAPLGKTAEAALPLRYENSLLRDSLQPGQKLQDRLALSLGPAVSVIYLRDVSGTEPRVVRGGISVGLQPGEAVPMPDNGVAANINLTTVDLDAWAKVLTDAVGHVAVAAAPQAGPAPNIFAGAALSYLPTRMAIRTKELRVEGRKLNNVVVGGSRDGLDWRANIDATELNGYVEFRQPGSAGAGRLFARLSRLSLGQSNASGVENMLDDQPASIPALDIVVEDMELRGKKLGRVEIEAVNRGAAAVARDGGVREWRLNKFNVIMPEAVLTATGNWVAVNALASAGQPQSGERRRTVMNFKFDIADSGELLTRFGMAGVIRQGKGKMEGQVGWAGSPLSPDYPSMSGQFKVNMEAGQFLKADPGIAKLLGVLSLQSLPRRLALDFRDVFSEGFAFDFVRGDVNISQGVAATNNLQMKGVNAAVLMEGSANIARETQDIKVVVVPEINAGTASLIATVINPVLGLGSFLAQYFLRRPLIEATTQEFRINGSWANPQITKVERKL